MAAGPRVPNEHRSFADDDASMVDDLVLSDRRDGAANLVWAAKAEADASPNPQGRYGTLKQNLTNRWTVQERSSGRVRPEAC